MSTRGFLGFVAEGVEKIAYNHSDSYPGGLGVDVLKWVQENQHELVCGEHGTVPGSAADKIRQLRVAAKNTTPTAEDIERLQQYANRNVSTKQVDEWYVLLRETQGNPAMMLDAGVIEDGSDFPFDSLFAEYGYMIDLDAQTFEAYVGFQQGPHTKGRFAGRSGEQYGDRGLVGGGYYPVALAASWPLADLPSEEEFLAALGEDDES